MSATQPTRQLPPLGIAPGGGRAPGAPAVSPVEQIARTLDAFAAGTTALRQLQSQSAARAQFFEQAAVTDAAVYRVTLPGLQSGAEIFTFLTVWLDTASGAGRYMLNGEAPTAAGRGIPIPAGGTILEIAGNENIRSFQLIAETGATLNATVQLWK